jgi:hypothetical protein
MDIRGQLLDPAALPPGKSIDIRCTEDRVGLRAAMDAAVARRRHVRNNSLTEGIVSVVTYKPLQPLNLPYKF